MSKATGILESITSKDPFCFVTDYNGEYQYCRPVRRDEVNFYEDRKDEQD